MDADVEKVRLMEECVNSFLPNDAERIALVNELLQSAFPWADSPQGAGYWTKISSALDLVLEMYSERGQRDG